MQYAIIQEGQRALVYENGVLARFLGPGKHRVRRWFTEVDVRHVPAAQRVTELQPGMERVLPAEDARMLEVATHEIGLLSFRGKPLQVVGPGEWVLWQFAGRVDAQLVDLRSLHANVPSRFWALAGGFVRTQVVRPWQRAVVFADGDIAEVLSEGSYALSTYDRSLEVIMLDMREQELQVVGQELITADKATLRLNVLFKYRIDEPVASVKGTTSLHDALYAEVQLAARTAVAGVTVDQLLEKRVELAAAMVADVAERVSAWGVRAVRLDIKDVVLPGDMKLLLNQVIEAEKRAAAQNILRREETAATRSLANTAKLLQSNPVLLRLKELELYKEMAERIPNLSVVVSPADVQRQLQLKVDD
jgi:regulator of protease activity HflC (stomatin/prohibitin superfamily)